MLNTALHLNPNVFEDDVKVASTREGFGRGLVQAANEDTNIVAITADLRDSTKLTEFANQFPQRYIDVGIAEQNLIGVAAGLASAGKIAFATSYGVFSPGRNWDFIRTAVAYSKNNVKIVASHCGLSVGEDGATHQALEDIALTRVIPNITVVSPCDYQQAVQATLAIAKTPEPTYLRLYRPNTPQITTDKTPFELGKAQVFIEGSDITLITTGALTHEVLKAAKYLKEKHNIGAEVVNVHTIKPLDTKTILESVKKTKKVVTIEEHQKAGGLGSAIAELLATDAPTRMGFIAINDMFGQSAKYWQLWDKYELSEKFIVKKALNIIESIS
ncbi:MAG: transketolase C-terminal domain-containing protein [Patescibacteria group bacterium]|uniref:Transketolase family protein n=1 Tax=candidate division WWE3 bacterium TaxID=2053526 RepID=A0A955ECX7_UNCKA|nr:transketolase family protein [candidate division WWE3 bacterium]